MSVSIDILKLRRPRIDYISPPVCEITLSGSGFPNIQFTPFDGFGPPGPLLPPNYPDDPNIIFPVVPGILCYTIYKAADSANPFGTYLITVDCLKPCCGSCENCANCDPRPECMGGCLPGHVCWPPPEEGCYKVGGITIEGPVPLSDPICIKGPVVTTLPATNVI